MSQIIHGSWKVNISHHKLTFNRQWIAESLDLIRQWQRLFPKEETWVQRHVGVPSLIVRLDHTIVNSGFQLPLVGKWLSPGHVALYEIEERPAGIGVTSKHNAQFAAALKKVWRSWPPRICAIVSRKRSGWDDDLWTDVIPLEIHRDELVIVRAEPRESEFYRLEPFSVSSLKQKGNKSYGVGMGLWRRIYSSGDLPWDEAFVLKPLQGSKLQDVHIWLPKGHPLRKVDGHSTKTSVVKTLKDNGTMYIQPFVDPIKTSDGMTIFRIYYGYNPDKDKWICLGGVWNARPNLRVHGATDSIFGPATL